MRHTIIAFAALIKIANHLRAAFFIETGQKAMEITEHKIAF